MSGASPSRPGRHACHSARRPVGAAIARQEPSRPSSSRTPEPRTATPRATIRPMRRAARNIPNPSRYVLFVAYRRVYRLARSPVVRERGHEAREAAPADAPGPPPAGPTLASQRPDRPDRRRVRPPPYPGLSIVGAPSRDHPRSADHAIHGSEDPHGDPAGPAQGSAPERSSLRRLVAGRRSAVVRHGLAGCWPCFPWGREARGPPPVYASSGAKGRTPGQRSRGPAARARQLSAAACHLGSLVNSNRRR